MEDQSIQIDPEERPRRAASRTQIRSLLGPFLSRDGYVVERLDAARSGIEWGRAQSAAETDFIGKPSLALEPLPRAQELIAVEQIAVENEPAERFILIRVKNEAGTPAAARRKLTASRFE